MSHLSNTKVCKISSVLSNQNKEKGPSMPNVG